MEHFPHILVSVFQEIRAQVVFDLERKILEFEGGLVILQDHFLDQSLISRSQLLRRFIAFVGFHVFSQLLDLFVLLKHTQRLVSIFQEGPSRFLK